MDQEPEGTTTMFDMKRPCDNCPFRKEGGIRLHPARARQIAKSQIDGQGATFPCHKTVNYDAVDKDDDSGNHAWQRGNQYCAGALNFALNVGSLNQMMRIAARTGWNPERMQDRSRCFRSVKEMVSAQRHCNVKVKQGRKHDRGKKRQAANANT
jgi:hypothetical protein